MLLASLRFGWVSADLQTLSSPEEKCGDLGYLIRVVSHERGRAGYRMTVPAAAASGGMPGFEVKAKKKAENRA